jgi:two-component system, chemotaxis family, CheB/CheR fusion protein
MTARNEATNVEVERFLSDLAHDLRNLLEGLDLALFTEPLPASNSEIRDMTHREIHDLIRKTESHLDRARLRDSRVELRPSLVELGDVCRDSIQKLGPFLQKRTVTLAATAGTSLTSADPASLSKIVGSLLHSAARLTADGDRIRVSLAATGGKAQMLVEIPSSSISDGRVERLLSLSDDSGLGLGVSRALARLQGGDLWWERDEDQALRFVLSMPEDSGREKEQRPKGSKNEELSILVVDDNTDAAKSLAMLLSLSGYETEVRHDGRSALEAVESHTPDVVLLDLGLPDIDGYEVCRTLRRAEVPAPLTVVAVSGRGDDEARRLSREAGFDAHLLKPIAQTELLRLLKRS